MQAVFSDVDGAQNSDGLLVEDFYANGLKVFDGLQGLGDGLQGIDGLDSLQGTADGLNSLEGLGGRMEVIYIFVMHIMLELFREPFRLRLLLAWLLVLLANLVAKIMLKLALTQNPLSRTLSPSPLDSWLSWAEPRFQ